MIVDTNALSDWAEGKIQVRDFLNPHELPYVPIIVLGEYLFGIKQSRDRNRYEDFIRTTIPISNIVDLSFETAKHYSEIRLELKRAGTPIPANDIWIAAIARQLNEPILSNDRHFDYVENLELIRF